MYVAEMEPLEYTGADESDALEAQQDLDDAREFATVEITPSMRQAKCAHGVHIPADETCDTSRYCGMCNPGAYGDSVLMAAMKRHKPACRIYPEARTLDAADYMALPAEERMAQGSYLFAYGDGA